jgi:hypothetical protein
MVKYGARILLAYISLLNTAEFKKSYQTSTTKHTQGVHLICQDGSHSTILRLRGGSNSVERTKCIPEGSNDISNQEFAGSAIESNDKGIAQNAKRRYEMFKGWSSPQDLPTFTPGAAPDEDSSNGEENAAKKLPLPESVRAELRLREEGAFIETR